VPSVPVAVFVGILYCLAHTVWLGDVAWPTCLGVAWPICLGVAWRTCLDVAWRALPLPVLRPRSHQRPGTAAGEAGSWQRPSSRREAPALTTAALARSPHRCRTMEQYADAILEVVGMEQLQRMRIAEAARRRAQMFSDQRSAPRACVGVHVGASLCHASPGRLVVARALSWGARGRGC
jgi:hypothetical protein